MLRDVLNRFQEYSLYIPLQVASITAISMASVRISKACEPMHAALFMDSMVITGYVVGHFLAKQLEPYRDDTLVRFFGRFCQYGLSILVAKLICKIFYVAFTYIQIVKLFVGFIITLCLVKIVFKAFQPYPKT